MLYHKIALLSGNSASIWEQFLSWYYQSTLHELLSYVEERYFRIDFHAYEHINLSSDAGKTAQMMILGIAIGLIIASVMVAYTRTKLGGFVRKLLKEECLSPEQAKTLLELDEFRNASVRYELSKGVTLKKFVRLADESKKEEATVEEMTENDVDGEGERPSSNQKSRFTAFFRQKEQESPVDFTTARFYIPEDLKYRADTRFEKKGSGWLFAILTSVGAIVFASLICKFLPDIVQLMDNIIGMMAP